MGRLPPEDPTSSCGNTGLPAGRLHEIDTVSLVERAQAGDHRALEEICSRYLPQLGRWAAGRISSRMRTVIDTGDLVQEVLLGTIRRLEDLRPRHPGSFPAYLRRALLNRIYNETQKAARRPEQPAMDADAADSSPSPLDCAIGKDLRERYENAMMRLTDEERAAVFLRVELKISYAEIASVLGKPSPDAARMAVQRALVRLGEELGHEI